MCQIRQYLGNENVFSSNRSMASRLVRPLKTSKTNMRLALVPSTQGMIVSSTNFVVSVELLKCSSLTIKRKGFWKLEFRHGKLMLVFPPVLTASVRMFHLGLLQEWNLSFFYLLRRLQELKLIPCGPWYFICRLVLQWNLIEVCY